MSLIIFVQLIAGLALLLVGAQALVHGAKTLAERLAIPPMLIGLTVVALGTNAPETAVSIQASLSGNGDVAVGSVIGSTITNILLILGLSALIMPLLISRQTIRLDVPVMIFAGVLAFALAWDGRISHLDGGALLMCLLGYVGVLVFAARRARSTNIGQRAASSTNGTKPRLLTWVFQLCAILLGLALLASGADLLIEGAVGLARALGLSELVIGLTLVAACTSIPELATSLLAAYRGQRHLAVGTVMGSCILNLLLAFGAGALVAPEGLSISPNALTFDFPVLLAVSAACLPIFISGYRIKRWEGLLLLGYYLAYNLYLVMFSTGLPAIERFSYAMAWYVLPLTGITLLVIFLRAWKHQH